MLQRGGKLSAFSVAGEQDKMGIHPFEFVLGEKKITVFCADIRAVWPEALIRFCR